MIDLNVHNATITVSHDGMVVWINDWEKCIVRVTSETPMPLDDGRTEETPPEYAEAEKGGDHV